MKRKTNRFLLAGTIALWLSLGSTRPAPAQEQAVPAPEIDVTTPSEVTPPPTLEAPPRAPEPAHDDLLAASAEAEVIFDGSLVEANVVSPEGMRILATEYRFEVHEWLKGGREQPAITFTEVGGETLEGLGMTVAESHRLTPGRRYVVLARASSETSLLPFSRIFQVFDNGSIVADESGRVLTTLENGVAGTRSEPEVESLGYLAPIEQGGPRAIGPPQERGGSLPAPPQVEEPPQEPALPLTALLDLLRGHQDRASPRAQARTVPVDKSSADQPAPEPKWQWCGTVRDANNYYAYIPNDDQWDWWQACAGNWNTLVDTNPTGDDWLVGFFTSGGNPIRDRAPVAGDGNNHTGVPTSALLTAGGYGTWASYGNPNGINFTWYSGGVTCAEIVETDSFVNPSIASNETQFRKSMTHELGHALAQSTGGAGGHEDRFFAIMYSGTFRQPPNYASTWYGRMDDMNGARSMLGAANGNWPGAWQLEHWIDMATWSQTHESSGSPGNLVMADLSTYTADPGDTVTIRGLHVENRGNLGATDVPFDIYLSTNTTISASDHNVWSGGWSSFASNTHWTNGTLDISIPTSIPQGSYYVGWITGAAEAQRSTANDVAIMRQDHTSGFALRQVTITCGLDVYEPDDSAGQATTLSSGGAQTHSICASGDEDWVVFSVSQPSQAVLETSGSTGDTRMWLYDAGLSLIEFDDDDGSGLFSRIDRLCGVDPLPPGIYYAQIDEFGDDEVIPSYTLSLTTTPCSGDIFSDGFESGNTSAWSSTVQ